MQIIERADRLFGHALSSSGTLLDAVLDRVEVVREVLPAVASERFELEALQTDLLAVGDAKRGD